MDKRFLSIAVAVIATLHDCSGAAANQPERLEPDLISTPKTEINFQIVDAEDIGIFTRAEADYSLGKIHIVELDNGKPKSVNRIGFSDPRYKDSDPWLSPSGNELYFISDRPAFLGDVRKNHSDYDIWRSRRTGSHWTAPEHLALINSNTGEFGPELNNGHLYFSSRRDGKYDIYRARMKGSEFELPEKLSKPFNTDYHDSDFTLTKDGRVALWWSTRPGGYGSGDIYVSHLTSAGWAKATNLGSGVNTPHLDFTPSLSPNNAVLYFATRKPFPGQEEKAADVYKISVEEIPALKEAIAASALERLKDAFGGESTLSKIDTISYRLDIERESSNSSSQEVFMDFPAATIAVRKSGERTYRFARRDSVAPRAELENGDASGDERDSLLASLSSNFLYYLTADDLQLIGPENISGHGDLTWFRLQARGETSPMVGLDPLNGRIVKVLTGSGTIVLELDYLKDKTGLIWPYRFIVQRDQTQVLTGRFSNLLINGVPPER